MYIWSAINVENQLINIKNKAKNIEKDIKFNKSNITLPLHISLKISCSISDDLVNEVSSKLISLYKEIKPFTVEIDKIELHETISWIKIKNNPTLEYLHNSICSIFEDEYNIPLHEYDKDFKYHITLFIDEDTTKIKEAFLKIKDEKLPKTLQVNSFIIGSSKDGSIGSYSVKETINI